MPRQIPRRRQAGEGEVFGDVYIEMSVDSIFLSSWSHVHILDDIVSLIPGEGHSRPMLISSLAGTRFGFNLVSIFLCLFSRTTCRYPLPLPSKRRLRNLASRLGGPCKTNDLPYEIRVKSTLPPPLPLYTIDVSEMGRTVHGTESSSAVARVDGLNKVLVTPLGSG